MDGYHRRLTNLYDVAIMLNSKYECSKVSALTILQHINFINNKAIERIKYAQVEIRQRVIIITISLHAYLLCGKLFTLRFKISFNL